MSDVYRDESIVSLATTGMLVFSDPDAVTTAARDFGLNLNRDNVSDTIRVYAEDQRLGYLVSLFSLIVVFFTLGLALLTNAIIYATCKVRRFFPLYLSGSSINQLMRGRILFDLFCILTGAALAGLISYLLSTRTEILIGGTAVVLLALTVTLRHVVMRRYLVNVCHRRS